MFLYLLCGFYIIKKLRKVCSNALKPYKLFKQHTASTALLFSTSDILKKIFKTFTGLVLKRPIKLWALDIFPVFTCKNQNCTVNVAVSILLRGVFMVLSDLHDRFSITFKSVAL